MDYVYGHNFSRNESQTLIFENCSFLNHTFQKNAFSDTKNKNKKYQLIPNRQQGNSDFVWITMVYMCSLKFSEVIRVIYVLLITLLVVVKKCQNRVLQPNLKTKTMPHKKLICLPTDLFTKNTWMPFLHRNFGLYGKNCVETRYMFKKSTYLPTDLQQLLTTRLLINHRVPVRAIRPQKPQFDQKGPRMALFRVVYRSKFV